MINNVSELFERDLKDFIDILESMESYSINSLEKIKSKLYTEEEISNTFMYILKQTNTLTFILISMIKTASQYRPTNIALQSFLNHLGSYISYITSRSTDALEKYKKNSIYSIRSIYKALGDIIHYTKAIKAELNDAIERSLFM